MEPHIDGQPVPQTNIADHDTSPNRFGWLTRNRLMAGFAGAVLATSLIACGGSDDESAPTADPSAQQAEGDTLPATTTTLPPEEYCAAPDAADNTVEAPTAVRVDSYHPASSYAGVIEQAAGEQLFSGGMEFFNIPTDQQELDEAMEWQPLALQQMRDAGFERIITLEPGGNIDLLDKYFQTMRDEYGITSADWGTVILSPEPIVGFGMDPADYIDSVNRTAESLCEYFPEAEPTVMIDLADQELPRILDALAANPGQLSVDLVKVGVQAYANSDVIIFDAEGNADISSYMDAAKMRQVADAFEVDEIWFSGGIIKQDDTMGTEYSPDERQAIAIAEARELRRAQEEFGLTVNFAVNFGQKKIQGEGRDFSINAEDPAELQVVVTLHNELEAGNIPLYGYMLPTDYPEAA